MHFALKVLVVVLSLKANGGLWSLNPVGLISVRRRLFSSESLATPLLSNNEASFVFVRISFAPAGADEFRFEHDIYD